MNNIIKTDDIVETICEHTKTIRFEKVVNTFVNMGMVTDLYKKNGSQREAKSYSPHGKTRVLFKIVFLESSNVKEYKTWSFLDEDHRDFVYDRILNKFITNFS